jgi:Right handed beta helix region
MDRRACARRARCPDGRVIPARFAPETDADTDAPLFRRSRQIYDRRVMLRRLGPTLVAVAGCFSALAVLSAAAIAGAGCDLIASPTGSDAAAGSPTSPFRTTQHLVDALRAGQTGCLRSGTYRGAVKVRHGGVAGAPITITSYPGETATVVGRLWVTNGANQVTVTRLRLDGRNPAQLPSPSINANDVTFSYDDVTNDHTGICFVVGSAWGWAARAVIRFDRIHDCGVLPARNHQHGIYDEMSTGARIEWNLIYDNADRGIQLYPDAQGTIVDHNVIDGNGEGFDFSGADGTAANRADVYDNLITNSTHRYDVYSWYPAGNPVGVGNRFHHNCVYGGRMGAIDTSGGGFRSFANKLANPRYVSAGSDDFRLQSTSPCLRMTGDVAATLDAAGTPAAGSPGPGFANRRGRRAPSARSQ